MSHEISLRAATAADAGAVKACVVAAYSHYIERMGKPPGPMLDDYTEVIAHLVARDICLSWRRCHNGQTPGTLPI